MLNWTLDSKSSNCLNHCKIIYQTIICRKMQERLCISHKGNTELFLNLPTLAKKNCFSFYCNFVDYLECTLLYCNDICSHSAWDYLLYIFITRLDILCYFLMYRQWILFLTERIHRLLSCALPCSLLNKTQEINTDYTKIYSTKKYNWLWTIGLWIIFQPFLIQVLLRNEGIYDIFNNFVWANKKHSLDKLYCFLYGVYLLVIFSSAEGIGLRVMSWRFELLLNIVLRLLKISFWIFSKLYLMYSRLEDFWL